MKTAKNGNLNLLLIGFLFIFISSLSAQEKSSVEKGKLLYTKGVRFDKSKIEATISGTTINAKILPCANCHGNDGVGIAEGGVVPSRVDWPTLSKPYKVTLQNGRKRGPYDERSLLHVIRDGIDPDGNEIDNVMPTYSLNEDDIDNLVAYLKIIGKERIPGVDNSNINIGVILPKLDSRGRSESIMKALKAYVDLINLGGGIYNRTLSIIEIYLDQQGNIPEKALAAHLYSQELFAFVASDLEMVSPASIETIVKSKIPVISAISGNPKSNEYLKREFYYLLPGIYNELESLVNIAVKNAGGIDKIKIVYDQNNKLQVDLDFIKRRYEAQLYDLSSTEKTVDELVAELKNSDINHIVYLGSEEGARSLVTKAIGFDMFPAIYTSGKLASKDWFEIVKKMEGKVYFSYPTWPSEQKSYAVSQYKEMSEQYALNKEYLYAQYNALSSIIVFSETLRRIGRNLSVDAYLEELQGLNSFESGFVSTISYGPNKRIGSEKVFIATLDFDKQDLILVDD